VCSDGLFGEVGPDRIAVELRRWSDPRAAARQLVELANAAGGRDNITCAIFDVRDEGGAGGHEGETAGAAAVLHGPSAAGPGLAGSGPEARARTTATPTAVVERGRPVPAPEGRSEPGTAAAPAPRARSTTGAAPAERARPRRLTARAVLFVLAVLAVLSLAALAVGWYATRTYFVGADAGVVAIYRGRPGGVLWFDPTVAEATDVRVPDLPPQACDIVASEPSTTDIDEARRIVERLRDDVAARPVNAPRCEAG
jgi:protein phosphatase